MKKKTGISNSLIEKWRDSYAGCYYLVPVESFQKLEVLTGN